MPVMFGRSAPKVLAYSGIDVLGPNVVPSKLRAWKVPSAQPEYTVLSIRNDPRDWFHGSVDVIAVVLLGAVAVPVKNWRLTASALAPTPGVTSELMISMPSISGFSTWCTNVMSTEPSLVMAKDFMVAMLLPGLLERSMFDATVAPSSWTE